MFNLPKFNCNAWIYKIKTLHFSVGIAEKIKFMLNPLFDFEDEHYPTGVCTSCRLYLTSSNNGPNTLNKLPSMPNYMDIVLKKTTRSDTACNCYLCQTASKQGRPKKIVKGRGHLRMNSDISINNGLFGANKSLSIETFDKPIKPLLNTSIKICDHCKAGIGQGYKHQCKATKINENVLQIMKNIPEIEKEKVVCKLLQQKANGDMHDTHIALCNKKGKQTNLVLNPASVPKVFYSQERLEKFKTQNDLSGKFMEKMTNFLRVGKQSFIIY